MRNFRFEWKDLRKDELNTVKGSCIPAFPPLQMDDQSVANNEDDDNNLGFQEGNTCC
jgi:hypothetical protein